MTMNTATLVPPGGGSGGGGGGIPPSLLVGKSDFVSTTGNNATAARQDLKFHWNTLDPAIAAALAGDTVFVYPGAWTVSSSINKAINLVLFPGATIEGVGVSVIKIETDITVNVMGQGIIFSDDDIPVYVGSAGANLHLDCLQVVAPASGNFFAIQVQAGNLTGTVSQKVDAGGCVAAILITGAGTIDFTANLITDDGLGRDNAAYGLLQIFNYTGPSCTIKGHRIEGNVVGSIVGISVIDSESFVTVIADSFTNNWAGARAYNTSVIYTTFTAADNTHQNIYVKGTVYAAGNVAGVLALFGTSFGTLQYYGDIYADSFHAILNASSDYEIYHYGNAYKTSNTGFAAVRIGSGDDVNGVQGGVYKNIGGTISNNDDTAPALMVDVSNGGYPDSQVIFQNTTLINYGAYLYSIDNDGFNENIKIYSAQANVNLNPATITNLIAATTLIVDSTISK